MPLFDNLTQQESNLFLALSKVRENTLWGKAINKALENPTVDRFRSLVKQLKSQNNDNPVIMLDILGKDCQNKLNQVNL